MKLTEAATVIRSKNAGPLHLTIDLMFTDKSRFDLARQSPSMAVDTMAGIITVAAIMAVATAAEAITRVAITVEAITLAVTTGAGTMVAGL